MKRLLIVVALLLLWPVTALADQPAPDVRFEEATLKDFTLAGVGTWVCAYSAMVNHTPPGTVCRPDSGRWAVVSEHFTRTVMAWSAVGLPDAVPGATACLWWYCYGGIGEMPHGTSETGVVSPYAMFLPVVLVEENL